MGGGGLPNTFWDRSILAKNGWGNLAYRIFFLAKIASRIGIFIYLKNHDFEGKKSVNKDGGLSMTFYNFAISTIEGGTWQGGGDLARNKWYEVFF